MLSKETMEPVYDEAQSLVVTAAPRSQQQENAEIATLVTPVFSECVNAVSKLLTPPPQGEMASTDAIPNNQAVPVVNSTCLKATCGGALLLASLAGYGARAYMQRVPANADGPDMGPQRRPETVQPEQTRQEQHEALPVVQLYGRAKPRLWASCKKNEIMTVAVGQGGNQLHNTFWEGLLKEHKLDSMGKYTGQNDIDDLSRLDVYVRQIGRKEKKQYRPRACLVDLEEGTMDVVKSHMMGMLFKPDNMVIEGQGTGNNWAQGYGPMGREVIGEVQDIIRREVEDMDCPQGFTIFHTLGGGTGSGLGSLILER